LRNCRRALLPSWACLNNLLSMPVLWSNGSVTSPRSTGSTWTWRRVRRSDSWGPTEPGSPPRCA
jgi:hypothetical protein